MATLTETGYFCRWCGAPTVYETSDTLAEGIVIETKCSALCGKDPAMYGCEVRLSTRDGDPFQKLWDAATAQVESFKAKGWRKLVMQIATLLVSGKWHKEVIVR